MNKITQTKLITLIIIILIMSTFILYNGSVSILKQTAENNSLSNISNNYRSTSLTLEDYTVTLELPETTSLHFDLNNFDQGQIRSTKYFEDNKLGFRGYIQMWKISNLSDFLNESKSLSPFDYKSYRVSKINQNNYDTFLTEWTASFGDKYISTEEYWISIGTDDYIRISFYADTPTFPTNIRDITRNLLKTIKIINNSKL
ncbi:hypothetical protein [Desulfosporosinus sp. FKA]|uniref:hypothetical protein n=1 Tax=Desulfosporosinus sp. FKA TaxID=1969834 RepID=UPI000B4A4453|nr:hypothetical protein [Desulfosporosinus sp. FKA]